MASYFKHLVDEAKKGASEDEAKQRADDSSAKKLQSVSDRVAEYIIGLLFAAHKNVAITTAQVVVMLLTHPKALDKVREELRRSTTPTSSASGRREMKADDLVGGMPYLELCVHEALRLTQHSIGSMRKVRCREGFRLVTSEGRALRIPQGYYVGAAHALIGRAGFFENAGRFDPEAHFRTNRAGKVVPKTSAERAKNSHVPFSGGVHACPGSTVAIILIKALVASWLQLTGDSCAIQQPVPDLDYERATIAQRKGPCLLTFRLAA